MIALLLFLIPDFELGDLDFFPDLLLAMEAFLDFGGLYNFFISLTFLSFAEAPPFAFFVVLAGDFEGFVLISEALLDFEF